MNASLFLVARIATGASFGQADWIGSDGPPFECVDPVDFLSTDIDAIYDIYSAQYLKIDPTLNVRMPEALLEYNRWLLVTDGNGLIRAFVCFKTTRFGLKLGLAASSGCPEAKATLKGILRNSLSVEGVYGEVSGGVEAVVSGHAPQVSAGAAQVVLGKTIDPDEDGAHYTREIANVGPRRKVMVGYPILD